MSHDKRSCIICQEHGHANAMKEYIVGLFTSNVTNRTGKTKNPFTGDEVEYFLDEGLTAAQYQALREKLDELGAESPDSSGYRCIRFPGGSTIHVGGQIDASYEPLQGITLEVITQEPDLVQMAAVRALALSANMYVGGTSHPHKIAVFEKYRNRAFQQRFGEVCLLENEQQLLSWVKQNIPYRDHS